MDRALTWMMDKITDEKENKLELGLEFDRTTAENKIEPSYAIDFNNYPGFYGLLGVRRRKLGGFPLIEIDDSAESRWNGCPNYRPSNLVEYPRKDGGFPFLFRVTI